MNSEQLFFLPEHFVDPIDIDKFGIGAYRVLRDLIVKRITEYHQFRDMFIDALKRPVRLLPSQEETLNLLKEADSLGLKAVNFIANRLGISTRAAYYRLETLSNRMAIITISEQSKTFNYDTSARIDSESSPKIVLNRKDIKRIEAGLRYDCPTKDFAILTGCECAGTCTGQFGICYDCGKRYGLTKEERLARGYDWVQSLVSDIKAQAYKDAERKLFERLYTKNIDISDLAM